MPKVCAMGTGNGFMQTQVFPEMQKSIDNDIEMAEQGYDITKSGDTQVSNTVSTYRKVKDKHFKDVQYVGREGDTMFAPLKDTIEKQTTRTTIHRKKPSLTPKEQDNLNKIPEMKSPESFYYPNRRVSEGSLRKEDINGMFAEALATSMSDEGIQFVVEKGVPSFVEYLENQADEWGNEYAGSWSAPKDGIAIDLHMTTVNGASSEEQFNATVRHEYGHMAMNRLWRMYLVNHPEMEFVQNKDRISSRGTNLDDITRYRPEFEDAFFTDMSNLQVEEPLAMEKLALQYEKDMYEGGGYDSRLEGYYDIIDAMTEGIAFDEYHMFGHGVDYYSEEGAFGNSRLTETAANLFEAKFNKDQYAWNRIKKDMPNLAKAFDNMINEFKGQTRLVKDLGGTWASADARKSWENPAFIIDTGEKAYVR